MATSREEKMLNAQMTKFFENYIKYDDQEMEEEDRNCLVSLMASMVNREEIEARIDRVGHGPQLAQNIAERFAIGRQALQMYKDKYVGVGTLDRKINEVSLKLIQKIARLEAKNVKTTKYTRRFKRTVPPTPSNIQENDKNVGIIIKNGQKNVDPSFSKLNKGGQEISEVEFREELESNLLDMTQRMRSFADSFKESLKKDNQEIDQILKSQDNNQNKTNKEVSKLEEFQKMSDSLGFWKLLMMGAIAIASFFVTMTVIMMTRWFQQYYY